MVYKLNSNYENTVSFNSHAPICQIVWGKYLENYILNADNYRT